MSQQKQQNSERRINAMMFKRSQKSGFLINKASLPPIKRSLSRKSEISQPILSLKKHKLNDIFYQSFCKQDNKNNNNFFNKIPITSSHLVCQHVNYKKVGIQQNQNKINPESKRKQEPQFLCKYHQKQMVSRLKTQSTQNSRYLQNNLMSIRKSKQIQIPIKLKPIKINTYQKLQLFDGPKNRYMQQSKLNNCKSFLTISQANQISQKLSKPKCLIKCIKKNCQCNFQVRKKVNKKNRRNVTLQKLQKPYMNLSLQKIKHQQQKQQVELGSINKINLRKIKNQKQISKKKYKLMPISKQKSTNSGNISDSQSLKRKQKKYLNQNDYVEQDSFIKGIKNHQKYQKKCSKQQMKKLDNIQIQIKTENQFGNNQQEAFQQKINVKISRKSTRKKIESVNHRNQKNSEQNKIKSIGYTFGNVKKQGKIQDKQQNNSKDIKSRNQNYQQSQQKNTIAQKILKIEKTVDIKHLKQDNPESLMQTLDYMLLNISIIKQNKGQLSKIGQTLLTGQRNCISSKSNKQPVNMFNRQIKNQKNLRISKRFIIPKQKQYVQFIKNYIPVNNQIKIKQLIFQRNFKVVLDITSIFFGQFEQNYKNGIGIEIFFNEIFEGVFQKNQRKSGILKLYNGIYQGSFLNNLRHGKGKFKWYDGQIYEGQWKAGIKCGFGVWKSIDGSQYQGEWLNNKQHGKGKHTHHSSTYQGQFKQSLKQGLGKQTFRNGDVFNGFYLKGKPNGPGKYTWADQTYYQGNFKNGLREGFGKWHQSIQTFYEGFFSNDLKNGKGVSYYKDGNYLQGQYKNGVLLKGKHYNLHNQIIQNINKDSQINNND